MIFNGNLLLNVFLIATCFQIPSNECLCFSGRSPGSRKPQSEEEKLTVVEPTEAVVIPCVFRKAGFVKLSCSGLLVFLVMLRENRAVRKYNSILIPFLCVDIGKRRSVGEQEQVLELLLVGLFCSSRGNQWSPASVVPDKTQTQSFRGTHGSERLG